MIKKVVLKILEGSFNQGFKVTLYLERDNNYVDEIPGKLPPNQQIDQYYNDWYSVYLSCDLSLYRKLEELDGQKTHISLEESATDLITLLNQWLNSDEFQPIKEAILDKLDQEDEDIRFFIQTDDEKMMKLPWHKCHLFSRYNQSCLGVSLSYRPLTKILPKSKVIKILAVIGKSSSIDFEVDFDLLKKQVKDALIVPIVAPDKEQLCQHLRQSWDILYFAGHSEGNKFYLTDTFSLTIEELRNSLRESAHKGLKLAFFNSCDSVGLTKELSNLHIPAIIAMRQVIPGKVAEKFLEYFFKAFAQEKLSLHLAVRQATDNLEGLEKEYPCATWLPVLCQHYSVEPLTWKLLQETKPIKNSQLYWKLLQEIKLIKNSQLSFLDGLKIVFLLSLIVAGGVMGLRFLGIFQGMEQKAFDQMMRIVPKSAITPRILVVKVTDDDIQKQRQYPLSDALVLKTLKKLEQYHPLVIGLDIYRDLPVGNGYQDLVNYLKQNEQVVTSCEMGEPEKKNPDYIGVAPPIASFNSSFSDISVDDDGLVRRHLFSATPSRQSPCQVDYSLNAELAFRYLEYKGIKVDTTPESYLKVGEKVLKPLEKGTGFYQRIDARGHQILLNWREPVAQEVTLTEVLNNQVNPDWVKNHIVLIGVTAKSVKDYFVTPFGVKKEEQKAGVEIQAQMVSHLISVALGERPLLRFLPWWEDLIWVGMWSVLGGLVVVGVSNSLARVFVLVSSGGILWGLSFVIFWGTGVCLPVIPSLGALGFSWILMQYLWTIEGSNDSKQLNEP